LFKQEQVLYSYFKSISISAPIQTNLEITFSLIKTFFEELNLQDFFVSAQLDNSICLGASQPS